MSAVPELAQYLHEKLDFCYILPAKFTSDPIEARFGWYGQVNGGNIFMSLKQLLEAEKKIRRLSLLQQYGLLAASKLRVKMMSLWPPQPAGAHPALKCHGWSTFFQE